MTLNNGDLKNTIYELLDEKNKNLNNEQELSKSMNNLKDENAKLLLRIDHLTEKADKLSNNLTSYHDEIENYKNKLKIQEIDFLKEIENKNSSKSNDNIKKEFFTCSTVNLLFEGKSILII
jgi:predicted nuclease with TOPRIM domain